MSADQQPPTEQFGPRGPVFDAALRDIRQLSGTALRQSSLSKRNALRGIIAVAQLALADEGASAINKGEAT